MRDISACDAARIGDRPGVHEELRRAGPVVRVEAPAGGPAWVVTDDTLARQVLADPRFAKDPGLAPRHWHGTDPTLELPAADMPSVTTLDGAEHRKLRRVLAPAFTRRRIAARQDRITAIARDLLTEAAEASASTGQPADLVARFTCRYPLLVVGDLLGIPVDADGAARAVLAMSGGEAASGHAAFAELDALVAAAMTTEDEHGAATTAGALAERAGAELGEVSAEELRYLLTAARRRPGPGRHRGHRHRPRPAPRAVRAGPAPPPPPALTFGDGPHACIGAQLAQLEARTVVEVLRADFPDARLAVPFDDLRRDRSGPQARRLVSLPAWLRGPAGAGNP